MNRPGTQLTDVHCHIGDYPDPLTVLAAARGANVAVFGSTVLPSEYLAMRDLDLPVLGLGFHPMYADAPTLEEELAIFRAAAAEAHWISEIGLDGWMPRQGTGPSLVRQEELLTALFSVGVGDNVLSLHSREAERRCADLVIAAAPRAAVFHWFAGDLDVARTIVEAGMLFSVNPMMVSDPSRAEFLRWVPIDALLLETDGPQPSGATPATVFPDDLRATARALARMRGLAVADLVDRIGANLRGLEV